ncbi:MBL fold metallo-hydrolase [Nocardia fluminea]|uniref:MBL fold metallo-hydrolase n=1 Tax=Nocardia fluminea TaxID=134984 RepID=UPI0033E9FCDD
MPQLAVTSFGHSAVRLERHGLSLVIDPGVLAPADAFDDVTAFLITHDHPDHVNTEMVAAALAADPRSHVWAPEDVADSLASAGVSADQLEVVTDSRVFEAAGIAVEAIVGVHAEVHDTLPSPVNLAYVIDGRMLHPGDAFPPLPDGIDIGVLFLPVSGPWMRFADAVDYVAALRPRVVVPIHDGDLNDVGLTLTDQMSAILPGEGVYQRLRVGETVEL